MSETKDLPEVARHSGRGDVCPLCRGEHWITVHEVATPPIVRYWRTLGYRMEDDFGSLPQSLDQRRCLVCGMHWFSPMLIGPPRMYEALTGKDWYYSAHKWEFREALGFLAQHRPGRLLEVGCGTGAFLKQARRFCGSVHGVEFNADAAAVCRGEGLDVREPSLAEMDDSFDAIAAFQLLEHVPDPERMLASWIDRLAPGGYLVIAVPNQDGAMGVIEDNYLNCPPHHATRWEERSLRYIAERFGLEVVCYRREPLNVELYATYTKSLLRQAPVRPGVVGHMVYQLTSLIHRAAIPFFFDVAAGRLHGHSHLAIYRRPGE